MREGPLDVSCHNVELGGSFRHLSKVRRADSVPGHVWQNTCSVTALQGGVRI